MSAPVFDEKEKKYTGFLDVRDLVSFVVFIDDDQNSSSPTDLEYILKHGLKVFRVPVDGVTCTCKFVQKKKKKLALISSI